MDVIVLIKGILIGLAVSIPVGPMGLLCVQRTLNHGRYSGFFSGLGAATADTIFALVAGMGITFVISFIQEEESLFHLIGGLFIVFFGFRMFNSNPLKMLRTLQTPRNKLVEDFFSVLIFTLSNPLAIFLFVAVFGAMKITVDTSDYLQVIYLFSGVFLGASLWWFFLSTMVHNLRDRLRLKRIVWINRITGGVLLALGFIAIFNFFLH